MSLVVANVRPGLLTATNKQRAESSALRYETKSGRATIASQRVAEVRGWFETSRHYASIDYCGRQLGLLVETDDEEEARREAEEVCACFGAQMRVLSVRKVVIQ